ncbi:MAG TPA: VOC family protein [Gaiellaceae bacterium]|nr:VOC family protein [Gaiellaceae bacterium]
MIDHVAFYVSDLERSRRFYEQALAPIGYGLAFETERMVAWGPEGYPRFAVRVGKEACTTGHVAFTVDERATVDAFYSAAMAAGGTENGAPGLREHYHPTYYAAFVGDPDGNNVEVVCHAPD